MHTGYRTLRIQSAALRSTPSDIMPSSIQLRGWKLSMVQHNSSNKMPLTRCNLHLPQTWENIYDFYNVLCNIVICLPFLSPIVNLERFIPLLQSRQTTLVKSLSWLFYQRSRYLCERNLRDQKAKYLKYRQSTGHISLATVQIKAKASDPGVFRFELRQKEIK